MAKTATIPRRPLTGLALQIQRCSRHREEEMLGAEVGRTHRPDDANHGVRFMISPSFEGQARTSRPAYISVHRLG
jgi:hypothetical protein